MGYIEKASRLGGVLNNTELALATATEADVKQSKTFYSGDKELKTGTYSPSVKFIGHAASSSKYNGGYLASGARSASVSVPAGYDKVIAVASCYSGESWDYGLSISANNGTVSSLHGWSDWFLTNNVGALLSTGRAISGISSGGTVTATTGAGCNMVYLAVYAIE